MITALASFEQIEELKAWFVDLAQSLGAQAHAPLGPDEWSLAQVMDHLVLVERGLLVSLARAKEPMPPATPESEQRKRLYAEALASGKRYEVPTPTVEPTLNPDLEQLLRDWDKLRSKMRSRIESNGLPDDETLIFDHPIGGAMNARESIAFLADHLVYHQRRVQSYLP